MLEELIAKWGYLALFVGTFFEGETMLIIAAALAHRGLLSLPLVMLSAGAGSLAGDQLWFVVGRRGGRSFLERRAEWAARATRMRAWLTHYGSAFVLGFRFLYGFRTVTPLMLGATGYHWKRFAVLNGIGAVLWSVAFSGLGWALGASLSQALGRASQVEEIALASLVVGVLLALVARHFMRRKARQDAPVAESRPVT
ncbi:MAG: DedA family protein [Polyangiaceae bacterium]|nr:DedA family protein [Polyangiaceae bacterium]